MTVSYGFSIFAVILLSIGVTVNFMFMILFWSAPRTIVECCPLCNVHPCDLGCKACEPSFTVLGWVLFIIGWASPLLALLVALICPKWTLVDVKSKEFGENLFNNHHSSNNQVAQQSNSSNVHAQAH